MLFATSIPMARVLGPERLGYFNFIMWLTMISGLLGSLGVPGAAGKFMAEYLGKKQPGTARAIFTAALGIQLVCATAITLCALGILFVFGDVEHRVPSSLQILSMWPLMVGQIPTQANLANESMRANFPSAVASNVIFAFMTILSLWLGWDLVGIAAGMLLSRTIELLIRTGMTLRWIRHLPYDPLNRELVTRMRTFALQQTYMLLFALLIWTKSDVLFLKFLSNDIRQVTFFTVAFNLVDRAVLLPEVFAAAMSTSLLAQYGRNSSHIPKMAGEAARYMVLVSMPLLFGMFLISRPFVLLLYGPDYVDAVPVLAIAALLSIFKPLVLPIDAVFRATGRQVRMLLWSTACGAINIIVDWILIPHLGAVGAAIANGGAQILLVMGYWLIGLVWFEVKVDWSTLSKISFSAVMMAPVLILINRAMSPQTAVPVGIVSGAAVFLVMLRVTRALNPTDGARLQSVGLMTPDWLQAVIRRVLHFLIRGDKSSAMLGSV
jgi:O-antigen/teichoic acid export membrane protein